MATLVPKALLTRTYRKKKLFLLLALLFVVGVGLFSIGKAYHKVRKIYRKFERLESEFERKTLSQEQTIVHLSRELNSLKQQTQTLLAASSNKHNKQDNTRYYRETRDQTEIQNLQDEIKKLSKQGEIYRMNTESELKSLRALESQYKIEFARISEEIKNLKKENAKLYEVFGTEKQRIKEVISIIQKDKNPDQNFSAVIQENWKDLREQKNLIRGLSTEIDKIKEMSLQGKKEQDSLRLKQAEEIGKIRKELETFKKSFTETANAKTNTEFDKEMSKTINKLEISLGSYVTDLLALQEYYNGILNNMSKELIHQKDLLEEYGRREQQQAENVNVLSAQLESYNDYLIEALQDIQKDQSEKEERVKQSGKQEQSNQNTFKETSRKQEDGENDLKTFFESLINMYNAAEHGVNHGLQDLEKMFGQVGSLFWNDAKNQKKEKEAKKHGKKSKDKGKGR